jgi:hypothetical protein
MNAIDARSSSIRGDGSTRSDAGVGSDAGFRSNAVVDRNRFRVSAGDDVVLIHASERHVIAWGAGNVGMNTIDTRSSSIGVLRFDLGKPENEIHGS